MPEHRVVIVGGGFGGLSAARALRKAPVEVVLLDRRNFHLFQPLLYQVATGALSPADIASPLRGILARQKNCQVYLAAVDGFDVDRKFVQVGGREVPYDSLILAAGAGHSYFGRDDWAADAPGLKTIEDATEIRSRILGAFEFAEREPDPSLDRGWLTFVVVGGGPTGVEMAGAVAEIARYTLRNEFRRIDPAHARILVVEAAPHVLNAYPEDLAAKARRALERKGVEVRVHTRVVEVAADHVVLERDGARETVATRTVIWAAGVQASPLARALAEATGATLDRAGRVVVGPDCSIPGRPDLFVVGDAACCRGPDGKPLPGIAPVAIQQGKYVARVIANRLQAKETPPFAYFDMGTMATIGRAAAIVQLRRWKFSGFFAWLMWLFVHLMNIVQFENRVLIFLQWAWSYATYDRTARLITTYEGHPSLAKDREDASGRP